MHLELEKKLAAFMGTEDAIIYSYDMATVTSTIPTFAKRGDLLLVDAAANYAIQNGAALSRAEARARPPPLVPRLPPSPQRNRRTGRRPPPPPQVRLFKHNDMADLERLLKEVKAEDARARGKPLNRRLIVVEGLYANQGAPPPLPPLLRHRRAARPG